MANVSITSPQSGMTVGTTFLAYGQFDTRTTFMSTMGTVKPYIKIAGVTHLATSYQESISGSHGYWQAGFTGLPMGTHCILTAELRVPPPVPPPAEANELTVGDATLTGGVNPTAPPPPAKSPDPENVKVAKAAGPKVKQQFTISGIYTPGPADIVIAYIRKNGTQRGESTVHGLNSSTKKWEDTVTANTGELGTDYSIDVELQHTAPRIATCAILGVEITT